MTDASSPPGNPGVPGAPGQDLSSLRIQRDPLARRRRRRIPWGWVILALLLAGAAGWWLRPRPPEVRLGAVARTYPSQTLTQLTASGYIVAHRKSAVAAKLTSRLAWLGVEEGSRVQEGQIVARMEADDLEAALARALAEEVAAQARIADLEADLVDAARNENRLKELARTGAVAQADFDAAETRRLRGEALLALARKNVLAATAAVREARVQLEYATLRAPFDGVILTKNADVGDIITPLGAAAQARASVYTMADLTSLQAEVDVSESQIGKVAQGQPCEIELDALPGERFPGAVHMIVPTADRTKATILVKARFQTLDPRVLPDMSVRVSFLSRPLGKGEEAPRVTVPAAALVERDGALFVLRHDNGTATRVPVVRGETLGAVVAVEGELSPGQRVILSPPSGLDTGMPVTALEE